MSQVEALNSALALPCWRSPSSPTLVGGGITNVNVRIEDEGKPYLVRLGDDIPLHGVMRFNELAISQAAHQAGIAPAVHYHQPGALVLEFIDGETLNEAQVSDPVRLPHIIDMIKRCHIDVAQHLQGPVLAFWVFHVLRDYAATLAREGSTHQAILPGLMQQATSLELAVGQIDIVLGHNDLLAANWIDDGQRLWLIDWEYGGFNSPLFDLGGLATNNGLSHAQEQAMLEHYFATSINDDLWHRYTAMKCASLLRETMWSMVSEIHSEIDFDYATYTAENLARFQAAINDFAQL